MKIPEVGLCGWNGAQGAYFKDFSCIEIQSTFYDPPSPKVAAKWKEVAPDNFHFCIKAWQLITHAASSPTYRRLRSPLTEADRAAVGLFQQTEQVWKAWEKTLEIARATSSQVILFQCPKSFLPTSTNLTNFTAFFRKVEIEGFRFAWEPRGDAWTDDLVRELCQEHDLLHCVDPLVATSVHGELLYWRLHGLGSYSYQYTDDDLLRLKRLLRSSGKPGYLMFNNFSSKKDALRFGVLPP